MKLVLSSKSRGGYPVVASSGKITRSAPACAPRWYAATIFDSLPARSPTVVLICASATFMLAELIQARAAWKQRTGFSIHSASRVETAARFGPVHPRAASSSSISPSPPSDGGEGRGEEVRFYSFRLSPVL